MSTIKSVGVIGIGTIGNGVAHDFASHGLTVIAVDRDRETLAQAKEQISRNIRLYSLCSDKLSGSTEESVIDQIEFTTDMDQLASVDLIVENTTENIVSKQELYRNIDKYCKDDMLLAANTSCISITTIGSWLSNPRNVIGIHFMNPVPLMKTVETIKGYHTSDKTVEDIEAFLSSIGKKQILVNDYPGFVSNRISHLFMNEAAFTVQDRVAKPESVDRIFTECFSHKMGPLATADLIGLDTVLYSLEVLHESYKDNKYRPCPLLKKMVDAGCLGVKSGRGFYSYAQLQEHTSTV